MFVIELLNFVGKYFQVYSIAGPFLVYRAPMLICSMQSLCLNRQFPKPVSLFQCYCSVAGALVSMFSVWFRRQSNWLMHLMYWLYKCYQWHHSHRYLSNIPNSTPHCSNTSHSVADELQWNNTIHGILDKQNIWNNKYCYLRTGRCKVDTRPPFVPHLCNQAHGIPFAAMNEINDRFPKIIEFVFKPTKVK